MISTATSRWSPARTGRAAEWAGIALCLFLLTGAVFPLLLEAPDQLLDDAERAKLRLVALPVYALTLVLLARHPAQILLAARRNFAMLALVLLPFASVLWSISPSVSLRRAVGLALSVALAYAIATRFTPRQQILLFGLVFGTATGLSLLMALLAPGVAYMPDQVGLRGIFVHKNVLGWVGCFTVVMGVAARRGPPGPLRRLGGLLLALGWAGTILSTSATSLAGALAAAGLAIVAGPVARARGLHRLVLHLLLLLAGGALLAALVLAAGPLLGLLGRDAMLTGRIPLWALVDAEIARRPWLGHGYGAFWSDASPGAWEIWERIGWQAPHAHSGYRDLLLGLGALGTGLFAWVVGRALLQGLELHASAPEEGWLWCPLAICVALVLNLSESIVMMQNDVLWVTVATAILSLSYRHAALRRPFPSHLRIHLSAS